MPRLLHGTVVRLDTVEVANAVLASDNPEIARALASALRADLHAFGYLFPGLQNDDANLLPELPETPGNLVKLGRSMLDPGPDDPARTPVTPSSPRPTRTSANSSITISRSKRPPQGQAKPRGT